MEMPLAQVLETLSQYPTRLVEVTGGEPLEREEGYPLMELLLERGYTVMLETGGHIKIDRVPPAVVKIIELKCPDSRECATNWWDNIDLVQARDALRVGIASRAD